MTSEEIKGYHHRSADDGKTTTHALWEIAYQLAVMNESRNSDKLSDPQPGKRDAESSPWPRIQLYGGMMTEKIGKYELIMHPGATPKIFDTEEQAEEYLRGMAKRMNDYEPGKRDADREPGDTWPKIMQSIDTGMWAVWLAHFSSPQWFTNKDEAYAYIRQIGARMNQYQPGEHSIFHEYSSVAGRPYCHICGGSKAAAVHIRQGSQSSEPSTETGSTPKKESL